MQRRFFHIAALGAIAMPLSARSQTDVFEARLRAGGCVVLMRHAQTVAGVGDPPGFRMDLCSTQRNLSEEGRQQALRIGSWFKSRGLQPRAVLSSSWCRCKDTADLAFGRQVMWPALNSFFDAREANAAQAAQTAQLRAALGRIPASQFEVWVTHQVNITALTGENPAPGEGLIIDTRGSVAARSTFG